MVMCTKQSIHAMQYTQSIHAMQWQYTATGDWRRDCVCCPVAVDCGWITDLLASVGSAGGPPLLSSFETPDLDLDPVVLLLHLIISL